MSVQTHLELLTPYWRGRGAELRVMLTRLADVPTEDECRVSIVEVPKSGNLHLQILRVTLTQMAAIDWSISETPDGHYFYEKSFVGYDPDTTEIERAFRNILLAAPLRAPAQP